MKLGIAEMLRNVAKETNRDKKKELLYRYVADNPVLGQILDYSFDPKVKFVLPEGAPPYKENEFPDTHGQLFQAAKRLYLFIEGQRPDLSDLKREQLFIGFLEELHPEDAKVVLRMKDKKSPYPGVTQRLVEETFNLNYDRNRPKMYKKPKEEQKKNGEDDKKGKQSQGARKTGGRNKTSRKTAKRKTSTGK